MMLVTKAGRVRGFLLIVRCLAPLDLIRYPLCQEKDGRLIGGQAMTRGGF